MKILIFVFTVVFSFAYELVVFSKSDVNKLNTIGFICQKKNNSYVCLSSNDLNELRRIKDFLKEKFHIRAQIVENSGNVSPSRKVEKNIGSNGNYCIQVATFASDKNLKDVFENYKDFPFARIEKIGNFYVLRVGEGTYDEMKDLRNQVRGIIRKCDIIPSRIIMANFSSKENNKASNRINNNTAVNSTNSSFNSNIISKEVVKATIKDMYNYLNNGDLVKAKEIALALRNKYKKEADFVLGIIAMKEQNFKKACNIFSSLNMKKAENLKKDACFTYYLKEGFNILNDSPSKALEFFNKALSYKNDINALIGKGYAYLNSGNYNKAYEIFKNLYEKYPNNEKIIKGYINTLYLLKKFKELKELQNSLPDKFKKDFSSIDFYLKLKEAQDLLKVGNYKKAEKILTDLYLKKPDDINVLLTIGNLYFKLNQLDKALSFYKNVLLISPDNIYALKAIEAIYLKKGDYKNALKYSDRIVSLGFKDESRNLIKKFYYLSLAKKYLAKNDLLKAKEYLNYAREIDSNDPLILALLGDVASKENKPNLAYMYYAKAYSFKPNDFGITLKFLYALLNLDLYDQIKIILNRINTSNLTPSQKMKLKQFYVNLYAKYSAYLLNNKEYKKALEVANNGLMMEPDNYRLLATKAWICLNLKKYECAEKYFKAALDKRKDDTLKYGLALVYLNLGEKLRAKKILDSIHTNDEQLKLKIASAYAKIGEINKAKSILNKIAPQAEEEPQNNNLDDNLNETPNNKVFPNPFLKNEQQNFLGNKKKRDLYSVKKKIVLKPNYNSKFVKEFKKVKAIITEAEQNYINNLSAGVKIRSKSGEKGTSKLERLSFPYSKFEYYLDDKKIFFIVDGEYLYSGDGNESLKNSASGVALKLGMDKDDFKIYLGFTPLGTDLVSPTVIGDILYKTTKGVSTYSLSFFRESLKDTITSYVGNVYTDKYGNTTKFGRVIKNGIKLSYKIDLDKNGSFLYSSLSLSYLKGENTHSNMNAEGELLYLFFNGSNILDKDYLGFYIDINHFEKNDYKFYPPYGGYFSPKLFLLFMPRYEGYLYSSDKKFISKLIFMIGGNYLDNWKNAGVNFSYDIGYNLKYLLLNKLAVESGFDYRNSSNYNDFFFTLSLRYYFGKKLHFNLGEINQFSKKVIKW